jgi:transcriptional regulator with XRE-family HTH domain
MEIDQFLRQRLEELDLSLADLETRLNLYGHKVTKAAIGHWLTGRTRPPIKDRAFVEILAAALEMSVNEMLVKMNLIVLHDMHNPTSQRIAELVDRLPPDKQDLALRLIEQLAKSG